ncbi:reverse transcriptase domain-containing protein [Nonomuraea longispora]|uniref:reverse transcriptase domain-containing protein n=1 Tax=Nonomuraea longispora TaxID=1848320 RepID=UPI001C704639|nr:reverse transcriptase domain-containing protein [Nonomuraea longispora]
MIPKTGGKLRRLGIPTLTDRVVQAALKLVLEPIFEADFRPCSYGFRPNRRAHDAIAEIHHLATAGYRWVLDADIEACFDRIDHTALMDRVRRRVKDKRIVCRSSLLDGLYGRGDLTRRRGDLHGNRGDRCPLPLPRSGRNMVGRAAEDRAAARETVRAGWSPGPVGGQACQALTPPGTGAFGS